MPRDRHPHNIRYTHLAPNAHPHRAKLITDCLKIYVHWHLIANTSLSRIVKGLPMRNRLLRAMGREWIAGKPALKKLILPAMEERKRAGNPVELLPSLLEIRFSITILNMKSSPFRRKPTPQRRTSELSWCLHTKHSFHDALLLR